MQFYYPILLSFKKLSFSILLEIDKFDRFSKFYFSKLKNVYISWTNNKIDIALRSFFLHTSQASW